MPVIRTAMPEEFCKNRRAAIVQGVHEALVEAIGMPEDELFHLVQPYGEGEFVYDRGFNGMRRSEHTVLVEITLRRGRSDAMKQSLYARIADNLWRDAQVRPSDVFIFMHENDYSDWSVGQGAFAMRLVQQRGSLQAND
jgi:phenylpyruvate tautomerase PptA (4-oxalocrotonate tautomerase family)